MVVRVIRTPRRSGTKPGQEDDLVAPPHRLLRVGQRQVAGEGVHHLEVLLGQEVVDDEDLVVDVVHAHRLVVGRHRK
jgi:hypothetical protein